MTIEENNEQENNEQENNVSEEINERQRQSSEVIKQLHEYASSIIAQAAAENGIETPDIGKLKTKYSLMLENEQEIKLINYTIFLYLTLKSSIIQDIIKSQIEKSKTMENETNISSEDISKE